MDHVPGTLTLTLVVIAIVLLLLGTIYMISRSTRSSRTDAERKASAAAAGTPVRGREDERHD
jgi:hypothetical protein